MPTNILMPALSPTMTEGTLARWLKREGEKIAAGDVIAEIETDKATMEVEAVDEGVLGRILVPDGTAGVKVNDPIAVLVEAGEAAPADVAAQKPPPRTEAGETGASSDPAPMPAITKPAAQAGVNGHGESGRIFASPLARRMAQQAGIELASIKGTGPNGRIVRADIETARGGHARDTRDEMPAKLPEARSAPSMPAGSAAPHERVALSNIRRVTARRLTEAKQTVPHFYVSIDVELDRLQQLRSELNAKSPSSGSGAFKLTLNDMLIKAAALTLRRVPGVNASFADDSILYYEDVDISVAVSIPDGLITPVIRQADRKGLAAISNETKSLIERARAGKLKPQEFQGGGFSVSNMGMYGVRNFAAIINPPQAAILAIASGEKRPVVRGDTLSIATVMTVTLSVDHRAIDGALAAKFVSIFKTVVEDPLSLML